MKVKDLEIDDWEIQFDGYIKDYKGLVLHSRVIEHLFRLVENKQFKELRFIYLHNAKYHLHLYLLRHPLSNEVFHILHDYCRNIQCVTPVYSHIKDCIKFKYNKRRTFTE
jgi:hypothetical protein